MKQTLLSFLFLFSFFIGFGQCPEGNLIFTSQAEIDAFPINFPDCTMISFPSDMTISGTDIVDLTPLSQIISVDNSLIINTNTQLTSLAGLENIENIGLNVVISNNPMLLSLEGLGTFGFIGVEIINNDSLIDLEGLNDLQETFDSLIIEGNDSLQNLIGLDNYSSGGITFTVRNNMNLSSFEGLNSLSFLETIVIQDNPLLTDISSLESLQEVIVGIEVINNDSLTNLEGLQNAGASFSIGGLTISGNDVLEDISALSDLLPPTFFIEITNNSNLSDCRIALLCDNITNTDLITIENNLVGCATEEEVANSCALCSSSDVVLTSQVEVDAFGENALGCDLIEGVLIISGDDIVDLTPLSSIQIVGGLEISNNPLLENLNGLNLFSIGSTLPDTLMDFIIENNASLQNIDALSQVFEILSDNFKISNNPLLNTVVSLNGAVIDANIIEISNNDLITSLNGLEEGNVLQELIVDNNDALVDIFALSNYETPSQLIQITNNFNLSNCVNPFLCTNTSNSILIINNNAPDCNSIEEVEEQCILGVEEELIENNIRLYPNPTISILNIELLSEVELQAIEVFSVTGKKVMTAQDTSIDFSSLVKGMYFARITTNKGVITKKIVKK
ncbi:T9SS type A sorting domain-containing protein [uncultured Dokdonia sp.]|uniref:T9SS type A sorting domain-containing protein n=1 Tax=uncultured Dokdonia sp. TaxID=575653 RepID=UPI00260A5032|nr:T9SS type A sorting domain-containing protein [uncultured Dokdonia sp.]